MTRPSVLVCDDEPNLRELIRVSLGPGWTVHEAGDGEEALTLARSLAPDLVILDLMMPRLNGLEVLSTLKADPALTRTLLLVAILSYRDASTTARHAQQAIASANQLETLALDLETGLRGFIITHKQSSLKPWRDARKRYPKQVAEFLRLASDNPRQAELAQEVRLAIAQYNAAFSLPLLEFMNRNPPLAIRIISRAAGPHRLDPVRQGFTKFIAGERRLADERNARARHTARVAIVLGAVSLGLAVLLIVLLVLYLARRVARPIRLAADAARQHPRLLRPDAPARPRPRRPAALPRARPGRGRPARGAPQRPARPPAHRGERRPAHPPG